MANVDWQAALDYARKQSKDGPKLPADMCLANVQKMYGLSAGTVPSPAPDAATAYRNTKRKHRNKRPPKGVPVWWTGGSHNHGHVAISDGDGYVLSTDIKRSGFFDRVTIDHITQTWGLTYEGWSNDLEGDTIRPRADLWEIDKLHAEIRALRNG